MDLTWVAGASLLFVGVGYGFVQIARRSRLVCMSLLCASLFALSTRDLFRPRERGRPTPEASDATFGRQPERTNAHENRRPPLFARLRKRVTGWLD